MKCPKCGGKLDGINNIYSCDDCRERYILENGELIDLLTWSMNGGTFQKCENCGESLSDGNFVEAWEDNYNSNGYTICAHCGYRNYR